MTESISAENVAAQVRSEWARVAGAVEGVAGAVEGGAHLADLLLEARADRLTRAELARGLLVLMESVPELRAQLDKLPPLARRYADAIVAQHPLSATELLAPPESPTVSALRAKLRAAAQPFDAVREADGTPVLCVLNEVFVNWGLTVQNSPAATFIPTTKAGVGNVVRWAAQQGKRVRASGYRHTWDEFYSADDQVLISMLPLNVVEDLPAQEPAIDPANELQGIELLGSPAPGKMLCKIGAATTNEQFRRWCLDPAGGNQRWTVPLNVIMVEITWGGSNAPICHGAGLRNATLSDLVRAVEFVNARGELQTVSDPEQLKAAAGCFGLLGIVTSVTLELDAMTFASMRPLKRPVMLAVPPPDGLPVPAPLQVAGVTPGQLDTAWRDFVDRCENDYYAEWFWFPYQYYGWINTWKNDGLSTDAVDYPSPADAWLQWLEEWIAQCLNDWSFFKALPGPFQGLLLGSFAMTQLPSIEENEKPITTPLIDALHFRRGIQNMRVLDMELEIPIPPLAGNPTKPDWDVARRAWWDAIELVYAALPGGPMRIALEMRITAGSQITMAPQYGNALGTCSIEVLTNLNVTSSEWPSFMQEIADRWMAYTAPDGTPLNVRPHWAKQWAGLKLGGQPAAIYLPAVAYADRIPEFRAQLASAAAAGGSTLSDLKRVFSNPLLDTLYNDVFSGA
jgi:hypothetical protein